jgi:hypothetical protein
MKSTTCLALCLVAAAGCQTNQLSGTRWSVVEFVEPDAEDQALINEIDAMLVEFQPRGRLVTTTFYKDGRATVDDRETYTVDGDRLKIRCPDTTKVAMYRMEGDRLRVHSPRFVMLMNPVRGVDDRQTRMEMTRHEN